jgi:hypothetical protein
VAQARSTVPNPPKAPVEIARLVIVNGTNRGAIQAFAPFSNDLIDLVVKDYLLDLFVLPGVLIVQYLDDIPDEKQACRHNPVSCCTEGNVPARYFRFDNVVVQQIPQPVKSKRRNYQ